MPLCCCAAVAPREPILHVETSACVGLPASCADLAPSAPSSLISSPPLQETYAERFYNQEALHKGAELFRDDRALTSGSGSNAANSSSGGGGSAAAASAAAGACYTVPEGMEVEVFRAAIEQLPATDNPELFGLHSNADIAFRRLQVRRGLWACLLAGCLGEYVAACFGEWLRPDCVLKSLLADASSYAPLCTALYRLVVLPCCPAAGPGGHPAHP